MKASVDLGITSGIDYWNPAKEKSYLLGPINTPPGGSDVHKPFKETFSRK